jgi:uncharacterized protein (DUF2236 family)
VKALPFDFSAPKGEPGLAGPGSLSWEVFSNPVALFVGGITAVILELAEPRVRSGVWNHSTFRTDPLARMERTGLAAMVTVFGAKSAAEKMIAGVGRMHARIAGTTPCGQPYRADDPELLDWVHATAAFGFLEAYAAFVRPLSEAERDRYYAEGLAAAHLYGATGAPATHAERVAQFAAMAPKLERSDVVFELLAILRATPILPRGLRWLQNVLIRAAVEITPDDARATLGLGAGHGLSGFERRLVAALGRLGNRFVPGSSPVAQAHRRLAAV